MRETEWADIRGELGLNSIVKGELLRRIIGGLASIVLSSPFPFLATRRTLYPSLVLESFLIEHLEDERQEHPSTIRSLTKRDQ